MLRSKMYLFGGDKPWSPLDWTSSDDQVRGGSSYSTLACTPFDPIALFHGNLDIKTLGGAGFASQRTTGEDRNWDLRKYDGIILDIVKSDKKRYTLILKDALLPRSPNGREQSTVGWEYDFKANADGGSIPVRWDEFKPTYRGREKKDVEPLDLKHIKRVSLMMRSFFGTQEGDFALSIKSISAFQDKDVKYEPYQDEPGSTELPMSEKDKSFGNSGESGKAPKAKSWITWFSGFCA